MLTAGCAVDGRKAPPGCTFRQQLELAPTGSDANKSKQVFLAHLQCEPFIMQHNLEMLPPGMMWYYASQVVVTVMSQVSTAIVNGSCTRDEAKPAIGLDAFPFLSRKTFPMAHGNVCAVDGDDSVAAFVVNCIGFPWLRGHVFRKVHI